MSSSRVVLRQYSLSLFLDQNDHWSLTSVHIVHTELKKNKLQIEEKLQQRHKL